MTESSMVGLNLSGEQLRELLATALFERLDPEVRKKMMTDALAHLMKPTSDEFRRTLKSPLQEAADAALVKVAREVCMEEFQKGEVRERISGLVQEALARVFVSEREKTIDKLAITLSSALLLMNER